MAAIDILFNFLWGAIWAMVGFLVFVPLGLELFKRWRAWTYPIRIIPLKNAGGGTDNRSVVLPKTIYLYAKPKNTEYGDRLKVWGMKETLPADVFGRDRAIPIAGGGLAYILYEKEYNQFFPSELNIEPDPDEAKNTKLKQLHEWLTKQYPSLKEKITFGLEAPKVVHPVKFRNTEIRLRPFPIDAITPFTYNLRIRNARLTQPNKWAVYAPYALMVLVVVAFIVGMVLYFEFVEKNVTATAATVNADRNFIEDTFKKVAGEGETPPGGNIVIPFIPLLWRRKEYGIT